MGGLRSELKYLVAFRKFIKCEISFIDILKNQYENKANKKVKKNNKTH